MATEPEESEATGKGRPTPKRKEREAASKRPLVANSSKERRQRQREANERARAGLAAGDERYLPIRDKGPQKKFTRDFVDGRWNFGEFLIPMMFAVIIATFIPSQQAQLVSIIVLWLFFAFAILDSMFLGWQLKKAASAKFGEDKLEKGIRWYGAMRGLQMRNMRLPKPQVARGHKPH
jgi:hypothetical protein